jgi:hypothetical protein
MPEEGAKFYIEKQEAKRDIVNVAGDYIIQHPPTHEPVYIPTIQSVLRKGETTDGDFFKKEPEWVDYEQGFIVERKEVDDIIKKLENENVQLVLGIPASGKSIILKNVGYKLANKNKKVHIVELKKHQIEDVKLYFEAIPEINNDNPIFIVDDAHLCPSECEKLIRDFKSGGKGKLIIGSRQTEDILPNHPKKTSEFQFLNKIEIHAENVTEEMIRTFLKKNHGFTDNRIKVVSSNLEKYKKDLWQLSWALKAYQPEKETVDEDEICGKIMVSITEIETKDRKTINGEDVFLPLSAFYRYEIPLERKFLEKQLGIKKETIEQLIELSEIVETEEKEKPVMLSLNHSSIAKLYFGAYQNYPSLGEEIKEKLLNGKDEKDLEFCLFNQYLTTTDPRNAINAIISLDRGLDKNSGKTLFEELIKKSKIQKAIEKGLEKETDVEKIGKCMWGIAQKSLESRNILAKNIDLISTKIEKENDIGKIGRSLWYFSQIDKNIGFKLTNKINIENILLKVENEMDIIKIENGLWEISSVNKDVGNTLIKNININTLLFKINKEDDLKNIGYLGITE